MNYIKRNDSKTGEAIEIFYSDLGKGKPVILIHGWPLSHEMWEHQTDALIQQGLRVIAYDRRGFGKSSKPWNGYDYDSLTDDLKALIDELNLEDITLVGFSMGGGEVVRYFSRYNGAKVSRIILISSVTPYMLKTEDNSDGVDQSAFDEMGEKMKEDRINFLDGFGKTFYGVGMLKHPVSTPFLEYNRMLASLASPRATQQCAILFSTTDFRKEMSSINVPALIIHGDEDKTVPIKPTGDESAKLISGNQYIIYPGSPHGLFYTEKERLNNDLVQFITIGRVNNDSLSKLEG